MMVDGKAVLHDPQATYSEPQVRFKGFWVHFVQWESL